MLSHHVGIRPITFHRLDRKPGFLQHQLQFIPKAIVRYERTGIVGRELSSRKQEHPHLADDALLKLVDQPSR